MDKKMVLKIGGIVLLSLIGVFLIGVSGVYFFRSNDYNTNTTYDSRDYNDSSGSPLSSFYPNNSLYKSEQQNSISAPEVAEGTADKDKSIIKRGNLRVLADDIDDTVADVEAIAKKYQAESQNTYDSGKGKNRSVNMEYKVKVTDFESFFNELKGMDVEFDSTSSGITDVTNEVMDLQARLKTYKNTEEQLLEIQKTAKNVTDTMAVYRELNTIRYQIESIESQLKYYSNQTDYSTVTISVAQNSEGAMIEDDTWKPLGVLKNALRTFVGVLKGLGSAIIWLVVFGVPIVIVVLLVRYIVKRSKK